MASWLRRLRDAEFNSKALRSLLGFYYREGGVYRIPAGVLRGLKMKYDRTINFHVIMGLWDHAFFRFLNEALVDTGALAKNAVICEGGANVGAYTLFFARIAPQGKVYSFEPGPEAFARTADFIDRNGFQNVVLEQQALCDRTGTMDFFLGMHHATSSLFSDSASRGIGISGTITVPTTSLDDYFFESPGRTAPDFIKLDIEGAGVYALKACARCIEKKRPPILIESHNPDEDRAISDLLVGSDYSAYCLTDKRMVRKPAETFPDPDGVSGTMFLYPNEKRAQFDAVINKAS